MDKDCVKTLVDLFRDVLPGFGILHAKTYYSLMFGEIKTARQVSVETGISYNKIYSVLKDLVSEKLVCLTKTKPACYRMDNVRRNYRVLVNRKIKGLEGLPDKFHKILDKSYDENSPKEYLIKFTPKQTHLFLIIT